jgi:hypothetical protein
MCEDSGAFFEPDDDNDEDDKDNDDNDNYNKDDENFEDDNCINCNNNSKKRNMNSNMKILICRRKDVRSETCYPDQFPDFAIPNDGDEIKTVDQLLIGDRKL